MHGIMMNQLRLFSDARLGKGGWERVCGDTGVPTDSYALSQNYPDEQTLAIVECLCELLETPRPALMEDFGKFLVPALLRIYGGLLDPGWRTLDVLTHTEDVIHRVVRSRNPGASPPRIEIQRTSPSAVRILYSSPRKLCGLARGITRGIAAHLGEPIVIEDISCMHRGDAQCIIAVSVGEQSGATPDRSTDA